MPRMSKKAFCVVLAKDVIKQVTRKKLIAAEQAYCYPVGAPDELDDDRQLDTVLTEKACHVCALGGLVAAYALAKDDTTVFEAGCRDTISHRLVPYFGDSQLDLIEGVFEQKIWVGGTDEEEIYYNDCQNEGSNSQEALKAAMRFGNRYKDTKARLLAIMRNIIKNEGRFVPRRA